jgi:hypothetical protein
MQVTDMENTSQGEGALTSSGLAGHAKPWQFDRQHKAK